EPAEQAASEVLRSFLPLDPAPIELSLLFVFRAREKHTVVMNDLLADQQISDAAPILEEVDGSFGRGNATGKVSTTRALSAVCSSAIRFSMKSRSRSDKFVRSNPRYRWMLLRCIRIRARFSSNIFVILRFRPQRAARPIAAASACRRAGVSGRHPERRALPEFRRW